jgi:aldehyde dehydrogenase
VNGKTFCEVARSTSEDIEKALDAAHRAKSVWGRTFPADRAGVLLKIADRIEQNLERLAVDETWDNGKPVPPTGPAATERALAFAEAETVSQ